MTHPRKQQESQISEIPPFNLLLDAFDVQVPDNLTAVLGVGSSSGEEPKLFLGAHVELRVDLGNSVFLDSLSLTLNTEAEETAVAAEVAFTIDLGSDILKLRGALELEVGASESFKVWGAPRRQLRRKQAVHRQVRRKLVRRKPAVWREGVFPRRHRHPPPQHQVALNSTTSRTQSRAISS